MQYTEYSVAGISVYPLINGKVPIQQKVLYSVDERQCIPEMVILWTPACMVKWHTTMGYDVAFFKQGTSGYLEYSTMEVNAIVTLLG